MCTNVLSDNGDPVLTGDLAPKSPSTGRARMRNESLTAPCGALTGTSRSVARTTSIESCRNFGMATRMMVRAEGTPPTAILESIGAFGGLKTKLAKRFGTTLSLDFTLSGVADTVSGTV